MKRVLGGNIWVEHRGTTLGDCSVRAPDHLDRIWYVAQEMGLSEVVLLQVDFTNVIAGPNDIEPIDNRFYRTTCAADGFVLDRPGRGVFIANGDCALGVLLSHEAQLGGDRVAVVMHLGLGCLWRADGEDGVLHAATDLLRRRVSSIGSGPSSPALAFYTGGAIQACCHGYSHSTQAELRRSQALVADYGPQVQPGLVRHGPRRGSHACDHQLIAIRQAEQLGVDHIEADRRCTSCLGMSDPDATGYGLFFSHTRDHQGALERNLALIALGSTQP